MRNHLSSYFAYAFSFGYFSAERFCRAKKNTEKVPQKIAAVEL